MDFHLRCERTWLWGRRISIKKPDELASVKPGPFVDPPREWTVGERLDADADALVEWAHKAVGESIISAIAKVANANVKLDESHLSRVLISSDDAVLEASLSAPWEFLERQPLKFEGRPLAVVRILEADGVCDQLPITTKMRVLVLWADPLGNIEEMPAHIDTIRRFAEAYDEKVDARILEFTSLSDVRRASVGFHAHVVYFVGHGEQLPKRRVHLIVGRTGEAAGLDIGEFATLIEQVGRARLIVLNACDAYAGVELNPYLGAALQYVPQFDAVIGMQTQVPIPAATRFAEELLGLLAENYGLAAALKRARLAMLTAGPAMPVITRFIPVLVQRTPQDRPFSFDTNTQALNRLIKTLAVRLERITYLPRTVDSDIQRAISMDVITPRVTVLTGPANCGKSTSVRAAVAQLLTGDRVMGGERYLYFSAKSLLFAGDPTTQLHALFHAFAREFERDIPRLAQVLTDADRSGFEDAVAVFASWFQDEHDAKRKLSVVFDDLPDVLLSQLAMVACTVHTSGRLLLVARSHSIPTEIPVERLTMSSMDESEIARAVPAATEDAIKRILADTNGIPYFVVARSRGDPPAAVFLERLLTALSDDERDFLALASLATEPLTPLLASELRIDTVVAASLVAKLLLTPTAGGGWTTPDAVRQAVRKPLTVEDELALRSDLFDAFWNQALREQTTHFRRAAVVQLYAEAFRQGVLMLSLDDATSASDAVLASTKDAAINLHYQHLERASEPDEALSIWEQYRTVATAKGRPDERDVDVRYAQCLAAVGRLEEAEELLRLSTSEPVSDAIVVRALIDRADVLKRIGGRRPESAAVLHRASDTLHGLMAAREIDDRLADDLLGSLEQSLANVYGYGPHADATRAIAHATHARDIFEQLHDDRRFRAAAEIIEIQRQNEGLNPEQRLAAIETIQRQAEELIDRSMQHDAVLHLYELGRLDTNPLNQARWFKLAVERAEGRFDPTRLHAAVHWRVAEMKSGTRSVDDVAPEIVRHCEELARRWRENAWSRRVRRDALLDLSRAFRNTGNTVAQREALDACASVTAEIEAHSESRHDGLVRQAVAAELAAMDQRGM